MITKSQTISLSLVSHTNVGKTTLARTLLNRNVGIVRDEPHVTETADRFELLATPEGDSLVLWDTPGFGDSARLADRLKKSDRPIGWLVSQVWDRLTDRAFWSSQQAVRNAREEADVVLYLVNAAENPEDAGYVEPEMRILQWIGKPIIVLVNQMGPPSGPADEAAEVERWRAHLAKDTAVRGVLALDAFARCWVQEGALLREVADILPEEKTESFGRLRRAWQTQRRETFDASMQVLAQRLARAALDKERVAHGGLRGRLRDVGSALGINREKENSAKQAAMRALAERLDRDIRGSTDQLIKLHGLEGSAGDAVLNRLADHYSVTNHVSEGRAAVFGGLVTGALAGLKADVVTGGFTLGGGMIAGGVLGALGAAGLARGYNMVRGTETVTVTWTDDVMNRLVASAMLAYLAVAHYGRGRGQYAQSEYPAFWENTVSEVLVQQAPNFSSFWRRRASYRMEDLTRAIQTELTLAAERVLIRLYPEAVSAAAIGTENVRLSAEARADAERLEAARAAQAAQAAQEEAERARAERERIEQERAGRQRLEQERAERERVAQAHAEDQDRALERGAAADAGSIEPLPGPAADEPKPGESGPARARSSPERTDTPGNGDLNLLDQNAALDADTAPHDGQGGTHGGVHGGAGTGIAYAAIAGLASAVPAERTGPGAGHAAITPDAGGAGTAPLPTHKPLPPSAMRTPKDGRRPARRRRSRRDTAANAPDTRPQPGNGAGGSSS